MLASWYGYTEAAVKAFQRAARITVDGLAGEITPGLS
ncbi:peptidoglycan-binding domain-containing protein [[Clostridium] hylemonae]